MAALRVLCWALIFILRLQIYEYSPLQLSKLFTALLLSLVKIWNISTYRG